MDTVFTSTTAVSDLIGAGEGLALAISSGGFWAIFLAVVGLATAVLQYAPIKRTIAGTKVDWISPLVMIVATILGAVAGAFVAGASTAGVVEAAFLGVGAAAVFVPKLIQDIRD